MARPIEKRAQIEQGVLEVVAEKGLHATTIQDIARAANVSPGLLYRYWENRDDLAADVYLQHYTALIARLGAAATQESEPWAALGAALRAFLSFADEQPIVLKYIILSQHDLHAQVPEEQGIHRFARGLIKQGVEAGMLRDDIDPDLAAELALGVVTQPTIGVIYGQLRPPVSRYGDEILASLKRLFAVREAVGTS